MSKVTRRKFLKTMIAGSAFFFADQMVTACTRQSQTAQSTQGFKPVKASPTTAGVTEYPTTAIGVMADTPEPSEIPGTTPIEAASQIPSDTPMSIPDLVVARNGEPEDMARRVLSALGGMSRFVKSGANVIIKPNICVDYHSYEYAATTNPWVVGALVKLCLEAGAGSVRVMDNPFGGSAESAYAISGIADQVNAAGGEMVIMQDFKFVQTDIPQGIDL